MDTKTVADRLGVTPKDLRRFLRSDPTYNNAGSGGRYSFTEQDMPTLEKRFRAAQAKNAGRPKVKRKVKSTTGEIPAMPVSILGRKLSSAERARRDELSRKRVDALEARLRATGKHISQIKENSR